MWQTGVHAEVEEASREVKKLGIVAVIAGVVLLALAGFLATETYLTPGLSLVGFPLIALALALFGIMGAAALYVGLAFPPSVKEMMEAGHYAESEKSLNGMLLIACLGGVAPGLFVLRAIQRIDPLVEASLSASHASTKLCPNCSSPLDPHDRFCRVCGSKPAPPPQV